MTTEQADDLLTPETVNAILKDTALTAHDRCDQCGSQAYVHVAVINTALNLMFCNHHYADKGNDPRLTLIRDERAKLSERPAIASLTDAL